jgi:hypothetical protein
LAVGNTLEALLNAAKSRALVGALLADAKKMLPHGYFADWLAEEHGIAARTAQKYMAFANEWPALSAKYAASGAFDAEAIKALLHSAINGEQNRPAPEPTQRLLAFADSIVGRFERWKVSDMPIEVKAQLRAKLEKLLEGLR